MGFKKFDFCNYRNNHTDIRGRNNILKSTSGLFLLEYTSESEVENTPNTEEVAAERKKSSEKKSAPNKQESQENSLQTPHSSVRFHHTTKNEREAKHRKVGSDTSVTATSSESSRSSSSSEYSSSSSGACSCCSCESEENDCACPRVCNVSTGCGKSRKCGGVRSCRSMPTRCGGGFAKESSRMVKSRAGQEAKINCSKAQSSCRSRLKCADKSSAFICASCLAQKSSLVNRASRNSSRKCCKKKTNPNHQCKPKVKENLTVPNVNLTAPPTQRNSNVSASPPDDVRGRLSEVERMLREVKENVIDKKKKLSYSSSLPEKLIRFEDEMSTNNNRRSGNHRGGGSRGSHHVSPTRSSLKSFTIKNNNNNDETHSQRSAQKDNKTITAPYKRERGSVRTAERPMEEEFRHLEKIKNGVAELKRRHIDQNLTLKQTQDRLKRALEKLESR